MGPLRIYHLIMQWYERRDERHWLELEHAIAEAVSELRFGEAARIGIVVWVRKYYPKTGTKGSMRFTDTGCEDAVWVPNRQISVGQRLLVSGKMGYGEHHDEPVFYINAVNRSIEPRIYKGWLRHRVRQPAPSPRPDSQLTIG